MDLSVLACVHGSTNGIPISFKVLPMLPFVIPLVPMVMPMAPLATIGTNSKITNVIIGINPNRAFISLVNQFPNLGKPGEFISMYSEIPRFSDT